jgi:uncharacterized protein YidB (DUF937 family)
MGFLDSIEGMASSAMGNEGAAGNVLSALQEHPGGLGGVLDTLRNNGLDGHADAMQNGQAAPMTPDQVQTGLQGSGVIDSVAERMGVSPAVAKGALAVALPMILAHYGQTGAAPEQGGLAGMLSSFLK